MYLALADLEILHSSLSPLSLLGLASCSCSIQTAAYCIPISIWPYYVHHDHYRVNCGIIVRRNQGRITLVLILIQKYHTLLHLHSTKHIYQDVGVGLIFLEYRRRDETPEKSERPIDLLSPRSLLPFNRGRFFLSLPRHG
jgi:hypothetical protein